MSAVPLPALVLAGTSDAPSSVAFILSAEAGPAKPTAAPSASIASKVLVLDMVFSLLTSTDGVSSQNNETSDLFPKHAKTSRIFGKLMAVIEVILDPGSSRIMADW